MITVEIIKQEGNRAFANKEYRKAAKIYRDALNYAPENPVLYANRAQCFLYLGDWNRALEDTEQGLKFHPELKTRIKLLLRRAIAQRKTSNLTAATESLKELLLLDPENVSAINELTYIQELQPTNKKPKLTSHPPNDKEQIDIPVEEVDSLPEDLMKKLLVSKLPKEAQPHSTPAPSAEVNEAISELFKLKQAGSPTMVPCTTVPSPGPSFSDRPSMKSLSQLTSIPQSKKTTAYKYVVDVDSAYYKDLFAQGGIEWEFLDFFFEAAAFISSNEPPTNWGLKVLNHLRTFTQLRKYDLSFQFCMESNIKTLSANTAGLEEALRSEYQAILGI